MALRKVLAVRLGILLGLRFWNGVAVASYKVVEGGGKGMYLEPCGTTPALGYGPTHVGPVERFIERRQPELDL